MKGLGKIQHDRSVFSDLGWYGTPPPHSKLNRGTVLGMRKRITSDPAVLSGTPVFRGTRIPLDHIVGLLRKGVPLSEIAEDYPSLSRQDIAFARVYLRLKPGRTTPDSASIKPIHLRRKRRAA